MPSTPQTVVHPLRTTSKCMAISAWMVAGPSLVAFPKFQANFRIHAPTPNPALPIRPANPAKFSVLCNQLPSFFSPWFVIPAQGI